MIVTKLLRRTRLAGHRSSLPLRHLLPLLGVLAALGAAIPSSADAQLDPLADVALATLDDSPDPVSAGGEITYTVSVENVGGGTASVATLAVVLGSSFVSADASQGSCTGGALLVTCSLGDVAPRAQASATIAVKAPSTGGEVTATAAVSALTDVSPGNNNASATTTVTNGGGGPAPPPPQPAPPPAPVPGPSTPLPPSLPERGSWCQGNLATIVGTAARDGLRGTRGPDVIVGGGGHDVIRGRGGKDLVCAGAGRDRVRGGARGDTVRGQRGNDRLAGGSGNDLLRGDKGNDRLRGGPGRDRLAGGLGRDIVSGVAGLDRCDDASGRRPC